MSSETLAVIIVALIGTVVGPTVAILVGAHISAAKEERDYKRQDEVADRVAAAAVQAESAAKLLVASNAEVAVAAVAAAAITNGKLDTIHTLVNSNMTAAMQGEHDSTVRELAALQEIAAMRTEGGTKPSPATTIAIEMAEAKINELRAQLADRAKQQDIINHGPSSAGAVLASGEQIVVLPAEGPVT